MAFTTFVRYGKMLLVGRCRSERNDLRALEPCIVRTDRGREFGTVLQPLREMPEDMPKEGMFDIVRKASEEDLRAVGRIDGESRRQAMQFCRERIASLGLPMKLVEVDLLFGGERVIFYFCAETRVDFRELVRQLAREFRTRVELRQIGARDEARLVGDCGFCGMRLCCRGFIKELGGITMEMAKVQKHTSDPSKITGRCGKLLCCLRSEYATYREARRVLPPKGAVLSTLRGAGRVVDRNLLLHEVTIEMEGGRREVIRHEEITAVPDQPLAEVEDLEMPDLPDSVKTETVRRVIEVTPDGTIREEEQQRRNTERNAGPGLAAREDPRPVRRRGRKRRRRRRPGGPPSTAEGPRTS